MRPVCGLRRLCLLPPTESGMRKIIVILLGLFGCLLFCGGGGRTLAHDAGHVSVTLSVDRASDAVWLCERESGPAADRYAADRHARGSAKATLEFKSSDLSVGLHAVDYYVYRLRRLII